MSAVVPRAPQLVRALGLASAFFIITGSVIGSGVFLVGAEIAQAVPHPIAALSVWLAAGLISLAGGLVFAELGAMYPGSGGQYVYLREAFGPLWGFLYNWTFTLILLPGGQAALAVAFGRFLATLVPLSPVEQNLFATGAVVVLTLVNLRGVRRGAALLDFLTAVKILALLALAVGGLGFALRGGVDVAASFETPVGASGAFSFGAYGVALIAALWAFEGWNGLSQVAAEVKSPQRILPMATALGIAALILVYGLVTLAYYLVLPGGALAGAKVPGLEAAAVLWGDGGRIAVGIAMIISALGCMSGGVLTGARVPYAAAVDGHFPKALAKVDAKSLVPTAALLLLSALTIVMLWSGRYDQLYTYVVCGAFLFYGLTAAALLRLRRRRPEVFRPFRVPLYPWLPLGYLAFALVFVLNALVEKPVEALIGLGIVLAGVPVYVWSRRTPRPVEESLINMTGLNVDALP